MNTFGVVLLNWNGAADTLVCLESLAAARPGPARVVVVDNGSADDSVATLRRWIGGHAPDRRVEILTSPTNLGFAGGNNLGLDCLRRDSGLTHFLLLNNDATVAPDFFAAMTEALAQRPDAALLGATIYEAEPPRRVWYAGAVIEPLMARARHVTRLPSDDAPRPTGFVTGCALMVSRRALDALGPLAECYFPLYMEDVEYSYRAHAAGLDVCYVPRAVVHHSVGATVGRYDDSPNVVFWHTRHEGFFVRRNLRGGRKLAALCCYVLLKTRGATMALARRRPRRSWSLLRGLTAGVFSPAARRDPQTRAPR